MPTSLHLQFVGDSACGSGKPGLDRIEIQALKWGLSVRPVGALFSTDKTKATWSVRPGSLRLSKFLDTSSTLLLSMAQANRAFHKAVLSFSEGYAPGAGGNGFRSIFELHLYLGHVDSVSISTTVGDKSVDTKEELTLSFRRMDIVHSPADERRNRDTPLTFSCSHASCDQ